MYNYYSIIILLTLLWALFLQDLMTKNKQRYRWRLLVCGIVFIIVLALVIAAAILLTGSPNSSASRTNGAPGISLEEWLSGSLSPKSFNGTWISGKYCTCVLSTRGTKKILRKHKRRRFFILPDISDFRNEFSLEAALSRKLIHYLRRLKRVA